MKLCTRFVSMFPDQSVTKYHGRALAQTVSRRPVFAEAWVRYQISLCATCGHRPAGQVVCRWSCSTDRMIVHWLKTRTSIECRTAVQFLPTYQLQHALCHFPQCHSTNARRLFTHHRHHIITATDSVVR